jgi:hypothetical protein
VEIHIILNETNYEYNHRNYKGPTQWTSTIERADGTQRVMIENIITSQSSKIFVVLQIILNETNYEYKLRNYKGPTP